MLCMMERISFLKKHFMKKNYIGLTYIIKEDKTCQSLKTTPSKNYIETIIQTILMELMMEVILSI